MVEEEVGPRNGFSNLLKEKVIVQEIWAGININNSWEKLLIKAPHSLAALEKLIVQSVTISYSDSGNEGPRSRSVTLRAMSSDQAVGSGSLKGYGVLSKMIADELQESRSSTSLSRMNSVHSVTGITIGESFHRESNLSSRMRSTSTLQIMSNGGTHKDGEETSSTNSTSLSMKRRMINAMTEVRTALQNAHKAMALIGKKTNDIPRAIGAVLPCLDQFGIQHTPNKIRGELNRLHSIIDECAQEAFSLEDLFQMAIKLADSKSAKLGRSGFMLLGEVKHFCEKIVSFCREISKLIEYTLDSSCNAFVAIILEQVEDASGRPKFRLRDRARLEIYQISLACVAYALSVRHLTDAYSAFSTEFLMPQMNAISRYPLVANSELELASAREQFKQLNTACSKEIDRVVNTNRATCKRRSILELDLGLDLHLSDISADLNEFLTPIAVFKRVSGSKKSRDSDEGKPFSVFERFRSSISKKRAI